MNFFVRRVELWFLGLFAIAAAAVWTFQFFWVVPVQKCERSGNWWDPQSHSCATVIYLPSVTHRKPGQKSASAAGR
jgi:hypothetical protein